MLAMRMVFFMIAGVSFARRASRVAVGHGGWAVVSGGLRGVESVVGGGFSHRGLRHIGRPSMPGQRLPPWLEDGRLGVSCVAGVGGPPALAESTRFPRTTRDTLYPGVRRLQVVCGAGVGGYPGWRLCSRRLVDSGRPPGLGEARVVGWPAGVRGMDTLAPGRHVRARPGDTAPGQGVTLGWPVERSGR